MHTKCFHLYKAVYFPTIFVRPSIAGQRSQQTLFGVESQRERRFSLKFSSAKEAFGFNWFLGFFTLKTWGKWWFPTFDLHILFWRTRTAPKRFLVEEMGKIFRKPKQVVVYYLQRIVENTWCLSCLVDAHQGGHLTVVVYCDDNQDEDDGHGDGNDSWGQDSTNSWCRGTISTQLPLQKRPQNYIHTLHPSVRLGWERIQHKTSTPAILVGFAWKKQKTGYHFF